MQWRCAVNVDVLAQEVSRRLTGVDETAALADPHGHLLRLAAEVETEWEGRARRSWINRGKDAIPAPSASASNLIRAAVLALQQRRRELLLLHVEGLTYRQIAEKTALPQETVLRDLTNAYCQLRWKLSEKDFDELEGHASK